MNSDVKSQQEILAIARRTLKIEADTLRALSDGLDEDFVAAVRAIRHSSGRLVVTGIGKSALVGKKIVATLNSTGTPALFMHAADAIHGDLGMILPGDWVLCLSKSGETAEIKAMLPIVRRLAAGSIGMCGYRDSYLARQADLLLYTPTAQEADPNNLAPTASTTAQIAMGDALAMALQALRGFSPGDFARYHPGGTLGKQLNLQVRDLLRPQSLPLVTPDARLSTIIMEISSKRLGATAVQSSHGPPVGIVTDGDLRRMLEHHTDPNTITADQIMTPDPVSIQADALAVDALARMKEKSITQLIVLEGDRYIGIVHLHDLLQEGLAD